jgi:hypothetical protein
MLKILTTAYGRSRAWNLGHCLPSQSENHIASSGGAWKGEEPTPVDRQKELVLPHFFLKLLPPEDRGRSSLVKTLHVLHL